MRYRYLTLWCAMLCLLGVLRTSNSYADPYAVNFSGDGALQSSISLDTLSRFSIDFWVRSGVFAQNARLLSVGADTLHGFAIQLTNYLVPGRESYAVLQLGGVSWIATGNSMRVPPGQWLHLAATYDGNVWNIYRNATLVGRSLMRMNRPLQGMVLGGNFVGDISRLRIWNRTLNRSQILSSMCSDALDDPALLAEYSPQAAGNLDSLPERGHRQPPFVLQGQVIVKAAMLPAFPPADSFNLTSFPSHLQFFSRDEHDSARVEVSGIASGFDSAFVEEYRNDTLITTFRQRVANGFKILAPIHAELSQYTLRLFFAKQGIRYYADEAADLVCGDAFIVDGQSNAHLAVMGYTWQCAFARTLGVQTAPYNLGVYDPADTLWGISTASGYGALLSGPYLVGSWARWMQEGIANNWHVPTCVINGAGGGSFINEHLPNDTDRTDLSTIYGRLLYRVERSHLQNQIKAIFWYQGEWDSGYYYISEFQKLHSGFNRDYSRQDGNPLSYFLFQTRPNNCRTNSTASVREAIRELGDSIPNSHLLSTTSIDGYEGCHYLWYGYVGIGQEAIRTVGKYLYGSTDTVEVDPPNVRSAFFTSVKHDTVAIVFDPPNSILHATPDSVYNGRYRELPSAFLLDGYSGRVRSVSFGHDTAYLALAEAFHAQTITYVPDRSFVDDTSVYTSPWIVNGHSIGALTFADVPIESPSDYVPASGQSAIDLRISQVEPGFVYLSVELPTAGAIDLETYDILGRRRSIIYDGVLGQGITRFDMSASQLQGAVFLLLRSKATTIVRKLNLY